MRNIISGSTSQTIKNELNVSALRNRVISNNLANINTKEFKRSYVSFNDELNKAKGSVDVKKTADKHLNKNGETENSRVEVDKTTSIRSDGNNVDIDNEIVNLTANNMLFESLTATLNTRFQMTKNVITSR